MSKQESKEEFDFNIDGIFGDFEQSLTGDTLESLIKESQEADELTDEIKKEVKSSTEKKSDSKIEEEEDEEEDENKDTDNTSTKDDDDKSDDKVDEEEEESDEVEYSYKALASYLSEQGVIDYEDSEDIEDTPELLEQAVFNTAKNMIEEYKSSIPEEGKDFLNYLEKGGDASKYFKTLEKPLDFENLNLEDSKVQKKVVSEFLKTQDFSDEEIVDMLQDYEDGLILEKQAKIASKKLEKLHSKGKEQLLAQQAEDVANRQKAVDTYINDIKVAISTSETLGGLNVTASDKKEFEKYLLQKDKSGLTGYEKDLQENPMQTQIELAYLKYKKFNFDKLAKSVKTEETKRIKGIFKTKDTSVNGNSRKVEKVDHGDLSGFTKIFQ